MRLSHFLERASHVTVSIHSELPLDDRDLLLVRRAEEFAHEYLAPSVERWERGRTHLPREIFREWSRLGLNALQVSVANGGQGASFLSKIAIAETLARTCMPSCFSLINAQGSVTRMEREGTDGQIRRYLPGLMSGSLICAPSFTEPGTGSDFAAVATTATKIAGGWQLDGAKAWVTNGAHADLVVMTAQTKPGSGAEGLASFIVDLHAQGVSRAPAYELIGGHAIGLTEIALDHVFVPDGDLIGAPGKAFKNSLKSISSARTHVSAMACGLLAASLDRAVDYAGQRQSFGQAIIRHQGLKWSLADVATDLEALRLLTYRAARVIESGDDATLMAAQAKCFAADAALRGVAQCMQAMGAIGLSASEPFGRHLASARLVAYADGTTEMQQDRIGALLNKYYGSQAAVRKLQQ